MLTSTSTFDDIKIGDKFKSVYNGNILHISAKNSPIFPRQPNITFMNETNTGGSTSSFTDFKDLFVRKEFVPYITTPQSLSSLSAAKVKQTLTKKEIADLEGIIDRRSYQMIT